MQLTTLNCSNTQVSDLSPLQGMPLTNLDCDHAGVRPVAAARDATDDSDCDRTQVSDLSPLQGMPLTNLYCYNTPVSDLSPLQGMNLTDVAFTPKNITKGLDVIRQMKSLKTIGIGDTENQFPPAEFWKKYDAGEFGKPEHLAQRPRLPGMDESQSPPCLPRSRSKPSARS